MHTTIYIIVYIGVTVHIFHNKKGNILIFPFKNYLFYDEKERIRQFKKQHVEEKEDPWREIGYNINNYYKDNDYNKAAKKNYFNYKKKDGTYYRNKVNQIMNGDS